MRGDGRPRPAPGRGRSPGRCAPSWGCPAGSWRSTPAASCPRTLACWAGEWAHDPHYSMSHLLFSLQTSCHGRQRWPQVEAVPEQTRDLGVGARSEPSWILWRLQLQHPLQQLELSHGHPGAEVRIFRLCTQVKLYTFNDPFHYWQALVQVKSPSPKSLRVKCKEGKVNLDSRLSLKSHFLLTNYQAGHAVSDTPVKYLSINVLLLQTTEFPIQPSFLLK